MVWQQARRQHSDGDKRAAIFSGIADAGIRDRGRLV